MYPSAGRDPMLLGALFRGGCVYRIHTGKGSRLPSALLKSGGVYNPNQVGSQITKLFPSLPKFCGLFSPAEHTFAMRF